MPEAAQEAALELLGTQGCHLCDEAGHVVRAAAAYLQLTCRSIDIALDDQQVAVYGARIPVLRYRAQIGTTGDSGEWRELDWPFGLLDITGRVRGGVTV